MEPPIDSFSGEFAFLSNFYPSHIVYMRRHFPTVEHAFVYAKSPDEWQYRWNDLTPGRVKRMGRKVTLRTDWDLIKIGIMHGLVLRKFDHNEDLLELLLATGERELIEGNHWGDTFWGVSNGVGENHLGRILMEVRTNLREEM